MAHGKKNFDVLAPRSKFYHGPFGRLFPDLPPWDPGVEGEALDALLLEIANQRMLEAPGKTPGEVINDAALNAAFSSTLPAGYTYFGQFIDHDITFDPASTLMRRTDPNGLLNFRTPRFDLDNIYGAGADDQPYLYQVDGDRAKLAVGAIEGSAVPDLPRFNGRALIGDARNDENAIVSQLQLAFLLAHNTLVDRARALLPAASTGEIFERARRSLRWLYQHIVWNDFVKRIALEEIHACALTLETTCGGRHVWECGLDDLYSWRNQPFMPVEFSAAAYRFGHSLVRNDYQTNSPVRGFGNFVPIFDNSGPADPDDLRGFRPMTDLNSIQWDWFLEMSTSGGPFPQRARKIDTKLTNALAFLHESAVGDPLNVLAFRNLKRGLVFALPSGSAVARMLCTQPLDLADDEPDALWYYVLKEGELGGGDRLGRVGSIIVCAVFAGLLKGDPNSWLNLEPCWTPNDDPLLKPGVDNSDEVDGAWKLPSIIRLAGIKANGIGFE
jgi:hypothetical protein